jgi:SAM-dependent methyltransferase
VADITQTPPYDLNIGAGQTFIPGFVNIDIHERAEVTLDLGKEQLPFPDDSVRTVFSIATLEHIPDYLFALGEIHRVLEHDGALLLNLPYVTLTEHHLVNPYHLHNFNERSFDFFDARKLKGSAAEDSEIAFRRVYAEYRYLSYMGLLPRAGRTWARRHLFNVVRDFDIALVAVKDAERPTKVGEARARELKARMAELNRSRRPYEDATDTRDRTRPDATRPASVAGDRGAGSSAGRSLRSRLAQRVAPYRELKTT